MLKAFCLGVASAIILALTSFVLARPLQSDLAVTSHADPESYLADDGPVRNERSANISQILGVSRKIYIIMNRIGLFLQITPDGTVSGTDLDNDYSIFADMSPPPPGRGSDHFKHNYKMTDFGEMLVNPLIHIFPRIKDSINQVGKIMLGAYQSRVIYVRIFGFEDTIERTLSALTTAEGLVLGDWNVLIYYRAALENSKIKIQGIATCNFLCMDRCGLLYGSREFTDECVFNEVMEEHYFNSYTSAKYSNEKRTLYLALNKKGIPRKVQTKPNASLDKLETYTNVLTKTVPSDRVESLATKIFNARLLFGKFLMNSRDETTGHHNYHQHSLRHHRYHQLCLNGPMTKSSDDRNKFRCRKREKRKKKRKCKEDEDEGDDCHVVPTKKKQKLFGKCEEGEEEEECQKRLHMIRKKRKSRNGESESEKDKKRKKRLRKKFSEKTKMVKYKCENSENCRRQDDHGEKATVDDYDGDGFTDGPEAEDETAMDIVYDWTTSAAVQE